MATARTYQIQAFALQSGARGAAVGAAAIIAPGGDTTYHPDRKRSDNQANAILSSLGAAIDKISPRLSEGDHLDLEVAFDLTAHLPQIARASGTTRTIGHIASEAAVQEFRAKVRTLNLRGVGTGFIQVSAPKGATWAKIGDHCQMALAMAG
jgi:hypothetical protein